jgi:hypothetical protein
MDKSELYQSIDTMMEGRRENWFFIGNDAWKQDIEGVIYPPKWSNPAHCKGQDQPPDNYVESMGRVDQVFLFKNAFGDLDINVEYKCYIDSAISGGIIFRAQDSRRYYILCLEDMFYSAPYYEFVLWIQEPSGYRREMARKTVPHSFNTLIGHYPRTWREWKTSCPDWIKIRIQAIGSYIRVSADGTIVFDLRDKTYAGGYTGLEARGAVCFRDLSVKGEQVSGQWSSHLGELPDFFYPGGRQPYGFNAYPAVCHSGGGITLVGWTYGEPKNGGLDYSVVMTLSRDEGKSWSMPGCIYRNNGESAALISLYNHKDGSISAVVNWNGEYTVLRSWDSGMSWADEGTMKFSMEISQLKFYLYSPMVRLSDGKVVISGYEAVESPAKDDFERKDRTIMLFSSDDGYSFDEHVYIDKKNYDHNECMPVEVSPGKLIAFMRPLIYPNMWMSFSDDSGRTWSPVAQSDVRASSPYFVKHSSGAIVMYSRGQEALIRISYDNGRSWTKQFRISPCASMIGMTEMSDGSVMAVLNEGYRVPGYIRGHMFRITEDGIVYTDPGAEKIIHEYRQGVCS